MHCDDILLSTKHLTLVKETSVGMESKELSLLEKG